MLFPKFRTHFLMWTMALRAPPSLACQARAESSHPLQTAGEDELDALEAVAKAYSGFSTSEGASALHPREDAAQSPALKLSPVLTSDTPDSTASDPVQPPLDQSEVAFCRCY